MSIKKSTSAVWNKVEGSSVAVSNKGSLRLIVGETRSFTPVYLYINMEHLEGLKKALSELTPEFVEKAIEAQEQGRVKEQELNDKIYVRKGIAQAEQEAADLIQAGIDRLMMTKQRVG